jgi:hypothetical protein
MFITGVNETGDKLFTPANNPCHGFLVIAGVVDTGDKFLTGEQLSPVTPVNNYRR